MTQGRGAEGPRVMALEKGRGGAGLGGCKEMLWGHLPGR